MADELTILVDVPPTRLAATVGNVELDAGQATFLPNAAPPAGAALFATVTTVAAVRALAGHLARVPAGHRAGSGIPGHIAASAPGGIIGA